MSQPERGTVAIVDYGLGNLFSVQRACERAGLRAAVTASSSELFEAEAVILPGVGAFGDAMAALRRQGLDEALRRVAASSTPVFGICLGMQLLMSESEEFGRHEGLGIIDGTVTRLDPGAGAGAVKVPDVGWNRIEPSGPAASWAVTLLEGVPAGAHMYFVHSFVVAPADPGVAVATTTYGGNRFCSSLARGNVFACQFHPERSGPEGLRLYHNLAARIAQPMHGERR